MSKLETTDAKIEEKIDMIANINISDIKNLSTVLGGSDKEQRLNSELDTIFVNIDNKSNLQEIISNLKLSIAYYLQGIKLNAQSPKADVYAFQIYSKLNGKNIKIDGIYGNETSQSFDDLKIEDIRLVDFEMIELDESTTNANEFLERLTTNVLKKYLKDIQEKDKISLSINNIYNDIINVLKISDKDLNNSNIFKGDIQILINNFLLPEEKGKGLITYLIDKLLTQNSKNKLSENELRNSFEIFKGAFSTLIDISQQNNDEKFQKYFDEFSKIKEVQDFIHQYPDLENLILKIGPNVLKTINKENFIQHIDTLFDNTYQDVLLISNAKNKSDIYDNNRLNLIYQAFNFLENINNVKTSNTIIKGIEELNLINSNPLLQELVDLLNIPQLNNKDRYILSKYSINLLKLFSNPNVTENELVAGINQMIYCIAVLVEKIPKAVIKKFLVNLLNELGISELLESKSDEKEGDKTSITQTIAGLFRDNPKEVSSVFIDNIKNLRSGFNQRRNGKLNTVDQLVDYILDNKILTENIEKSNFDLVGRLKTILQISLSQQVIKIRNKLLENQNKDKLDKTKIEQVQKSSSNFGEILSENIVLILKETLLTKIFSNIDNNISKKEIIKLLINTIKKTINHNPKQFFDNLKGLGIVVSDENKEKFLQNTLNNLVDDPRFSNMIDGILTNLINNIDTSKDILEQINNLIFEFCHKGNQSKLIDENIIENGTDLLIEKFYKSIENKEFIKIILENLPGIKKEINQYLSDGQVLSFIQILKNNISVDLIKNIINSDKYTLLSLSDNNSLIELANDILNHKDTSKKQLIDQLIESKIIKDISKKSQSDSIEIAGDKKIIDLETINNSIDLIYTIVDGSDQEQFGLLIDQIGLDQIFGESIYLLCQDIDINKCKEVLKNNIDLLNDAINDNTNTDDILKLVSELYAEIPIEKRNQLIKNLIGTGILDPDYLEGEDNNEEKTWIELNFENTEYISVLIYDTIEAENSDEIINNVQDLLKKYGLYEIFDKQIFGQDLLENIISVLKIIGKQNFDNFLTSNISQINSLKKINDQNEKNKIYSKLSIDLFKIIDIKELTENIDEDKLNVTEQFLLGIGEHIQTIINNDPEIEDFIQNSLSIKNIFDKKITVNKKSPEYEKIQQYGLKAFDIANNLLNKTDPKLLNQYLDSLENSDNKNKNNGSEKKLLKHLKSNFIRNNLWFCISQTFQTIFTGKKDNGTLICEYFSDTKNKDNFSLTLANFFVDYTNS